MLDGRKGVKTDHFLSAEQFSSAETATKVPGLHIYVLATHRTETPTTVRQRRKPCGNPSILRLGSMLCPRVSRPGGRGGTGNTVSVEEGPGSTGQGGR